MMPIPKCICVLTWIIKTNANLLRSLRYTANEWVEIRLREQ